jgi:hypothetical protein
MSEGQEFEAIEPIAFDAPFVDVGPGNALDHVCLILWDAKESIEAILPAVLARRIGETLGAPKALAASQRAPHIQAPQSAFRYVVTKFTYNADANALTLADRKGGINFILSDSLRDEIAETLRVKGSMILNGQKIPHGVW